MQMGLLERIKRQQVRLLAKLAANRPARSRWTRAHA